MQERNIFGGGSVAGCNVTNFFLATAEQRGQLGVRINRGVGSVRFGYGAGGISAGLFAGRRAVLRTSMPGAVVAGSNLGVAVGPCAQPTAVPVHIKSSHVLVGTARIGKKYVWFSQRFTCI